MDQHLLDCVHKHEGEPENLLEVSVKKNVIDKIKMS